MGVRKNKPQQQQQQQPQWEKQYQQLAGEREMRFVVFHYFSFLVGFFDFLAEKKNFH